VLAILQSNSIFNVLNEENVKRRPVAVDQRSNPRCPMARLRHRGLAVRVPARAVVPRRQGASRRGDGAGDTLGLRIADRRSGKYFISLRPARGDGRSQIPAGRRAADLFRRHVWRDDELIAAGLATRRDKGWDIFRCRAITARSQALPASTSAKSFLHINNSNPRCAQLG